MSRYDWIVDWDVKHQHKTQETAFNKVPDEYNQTLVESVITNMA